MILNHTYYIDLRSLTPQFFIEAPPVVVDRLVEWYQKSAFTISLPSFSYGKRDLDLTGMFALLLYTSQI